MRTSPIKSGLMYVAELAFEPQRAPPPASTPSRCMLTVPKAVRPAKLPLTPSALIRTPGIERYSSNTLLLTVGRSCTRCCDSTSPTEELDVANSVSTATVTSTPVLSEATLSAKFKRILSAFPSWTFVYVFV